MLKATLFFLMSVLILQSCNHQPKRNSQPILKKPVETVVATKNQQERRAGSEQYCKLHGVPFYSNPTAMFTDDDTEVIIRSKDEMVDRALALLYVSLKGEGLDQKSLDQINKDYTIRQKLTPNEIVFADNKMSTGQQKTEAIWRYESLHVLLWALHFVDSLAYPDQMCNVADDARIMHDLSEQQFRAKAIPRTKKEILDQADLILRLDWACVQANLDHKAMPGHLDRDVVMERHQTLNWLIRYLNQNWDDVTTDT